MSLSLFIPFPDPSLFRFRGVILIIFPFSLFAIICPSFLPFFPLFYYIFLLHILRNNEIRCVSRFAKCLLIGIIFLRHPLTTQTNGTLCYSLVAWNTLNCCTNKVRNWKSFFFIWFYFLTQWILADRIVCFMCVFFFFFWRDLPLRKHGITSDRTSGRIQSSLFRPSFFI